MTVIDRIPEERRWKWTGEAAERAVAAGILPEGGRWEIVDGQLVEKMPQGDPHYWFVNFLQLALAEAFRGQEIFVTGPGPIRLETGQEPEPDLSVVRGSIWSLGIRKPAPADLLFVVEVSVTSVKADTGWKRTLYAEHGIPEYWAFDLNARTLTVHTDPSEAEYRSVRIVRPDEPLPVLDRSLDSILEQVGGVF